MKDDPLFQREKHQNSENTYMCIRIGKEGRH